MKNIHTVLVMALAIAGLAQAAVSPEEAKQLGSTLTPWGAIKAGNKEGTIPPYEGGLTMTATPQGFVKDSGRWPDPFANEKPLYSITAKNMDQYADKLSEVTREMLKRFPATYRLDVYPTHRVANYPQHFIDNSIKNAIRCKTIENELALGDDCFGGTPFPIPKSGNEQMWNVAVGFKTPIELTFQSVYVDAAGTPILSAIQSSSMESPYHNHKDTLESFKKKGGWSFRGDAIASYPPSIAGNGTMIVYYVNPVENPNKGWNYQQGNRRVRAIPDAQYDFPLLPSGGAMFYDEGTLFQGKMDRFDFKLLGTREMIIPYNMYRAVQADKDVMTSAGGGHHPNPDLMRWELHRVRVVEATLKPGMRHAFAKRRFYMDEDHSTEGMADAWDHAGKLYRGNFTLAFWGYGAPGLVFTNDSLEFDLSTGIWYMSAHLGNAGVKFVDYKPDKYFTAEGLARRSSR